MGTASRPVTSADVAKAAGVSRSTVSVVLNGVDSIALAEETKERVRRAASDLGYVPHSGARALRSGYSGIVLMPSPGTALGRVVGEWTAHLEEALNQLGLTFVMFGSRGLAPLDAARAWSQLRPVAVLTLGSTALSPDAADILRRNGTRALLATGERPLEGSHVLVTGQADAGAVAVEHLLGRGRRRIAFVRPQMQGLASLVQERYQRAARVAAAQGVQLFDLPMTLDRNSAVSATEFCREHHVDGVFGFGDEYALLLMSALRREGLVVPRDVALVGVDDLVEGTLSEPPLTTVHIEFPDAAHVAATIARLARGDRDATGITYAPRPRLVVRQSS